MLKNIAVLSVFILFFKASYSQSIAADTASQQKGLNNYIQAYTNAIGQQSRLYNGPEYDPADPTIKGNAFFNDINSWKPGTVNYDHVLYENVPMMYDIFKDCLVALYYNKASSYMLLNEKLQSFDLAGDHFVIINADSSAVPGIRNGIYKQLYKDKTELLVKTSKTMQISTSSSSERYFTKAKQDFYLKNGDRYYSINGKASILKALKSKQLQVQAFIRNNNINFKKDPEQALIKIAFYYDHLNN